jgi:hypothetical protein
MEKASPARILYRLLKYEAYAIILHTKRNTAQKLKQSIAHVSV